MHGNLVENGRLLNPLRQAAAADAARASVCDVGVCVPFPYLAQVAAALTDCTITWGAQDVSAQDKGAFTGEVSGSMLADFDCRWVLVGHS